MSHEIDHEINWIIDTQQVAIRATETVENGETQFGIDAVIVEAQDLIEDLFYASHMKTKDALLLHMVYQPIDIKQYFTDSFISKLEDEVWESITKGRVDAKADDKHERGIV